MRSEIRGGIIVRNQERRQPCPGLNALAMQAGIVYNIGVDALGRSDNWGEWADRICRAFPGGADQGMLPSHFLRATFASIGGRIVHVRSGSTQYWGLLLPAGVRTDSQWTLRSYWASGSQAEKESIRALINSSLTEGGFAGVCWYDYAARAGEWYGGRALARTQDGLVFGEPDCDQAAQARDLQRTIWNITDPAFLYPADLYDPHSGLASRLVASDNAKVIGFLLGFFGRGRQWYGQSQGFRDGQWEESQLMGVRREYRARGIAKTLKLLQREDALEQGIQVIHWTVDPLQAGNARLNFNSLGGVAVQHYMNHYPFRNGLNLVRSSRIGISWFVDSPRVRECISGNLGPLDYQHIRRDSGTELITPVTAAQEGLRGFDAQDWEPGGTTILLEIPTGWNSMQRENAALAEIWRNVSDDILARLLGSNPIPEYAITGILNPPSENKAYLVIQKLVADIGV